MSTLRERIEAAIAADDAAAPKQPEVVVDTSSINCLDCGGHKTAHYQGSELVDRDTYHFWECERCSARRARFESRRSSHSATKGH